MVNRILWAFFALWVGVTEGAEAKLYLQLGHSSGVLSAAFSRDGRWVLTGGQDGSARVWEAATGYEMRRLEGHVGPIMSVAFSPDGKLALTGSWDHTARVWDVAAGREIRRLEGHSDAIFSVAFSHDGRWALTGGDDNTARIWDVSTGAEIRRLEGHSKRVSSVAFSPDDRWILTGSWDLTVRVWDAATGREIRRLEGHSAPVLAVAFSPDGRWALTGGEDAIARLWEVATGKEIGRLEPHAKGIDSVAFSPDGRQALLGDGFTSELFDVATGNAIRKLDGYCVAFSPDGRLGLAFGYLNTAELYDLDTGKAIRRFAGSSDWVRSVAFSPDGHWALTESGTSLQQWDLTTGQAVRRLKGDRMAFSSDGRRVLTGSESGVIWLWDLATGKEVERMERASHGITSMALSADGRLALTGFDDGSAWLWELATGKQVRRLEGHSNAVASVAFSPDGRLALTGGEDGTARIWEVDTGREIHRLEGSAEVRSVAFSPDGRLALTGGYGLLTSPNSACRLWDVASGKEIRRMEGSHDVYSAAFSPDGRWVVTGNGDHTVRVWEVATGKEIRRLEGHSGPVDSVTFSPDGHWILTGSWDGAVRLWDAGSGKWLASLVSFKTAGWAVVDPEGRYDASDPDNAPGLHWAVTGQMNLIGLGQLRRSFFTPGLLRRILQGETLPGVRGLNEIVNLPPEVAARVVQDAKRSMLRVTLKHGGTGIGRIVIKINGRPFDAPLASRTPEDRGEVRNYDLAGSNFAPGENSIAVSGYGSDNQIESIPVRIAWLQPDRARGVLTPATSVTKAHDAGCNGRFYGVFVGVSRFGDEGLNLSYPGQDAEALAHAVRLGAESMCGKENVDIRVLTTEQKDAGAQPSKENIHAALERVARQSTRRDLLFLYFAGHAATPSNERRSYFFLTKDARSVDVDRADALRNATTISGEELVTWLRNPQLPDKQVLILDTCAAGAAGEQLALLAKARSVGDDLRKAVDEYNQDSGTFILMGSAQDRSSYESERFGHGLLTYALLRGMRGDALLDGNRLEAAHWFDVTVPAVAQYARLIGREQEPQKAVPSSAGGLPVGFLPESLREQIVLREPASEILRLTTCYQEPVDGPLRDPMKLGALIRSELRALSQAGSRGREAAVSYNDNSTEDAPGTFTPQVRYRVEGSELKVTVTLMTGEKTVGEEVMTTPGGEVQSAAKEIAARIVKLAASGTQ